MSRSVEAELGRAEDLFENWIGFDMRGAAPRRLKEFLITRSETLGYPTVSDYLDDLPADRPTAEEAQRLVNVVTNGLTCFWRDAAQLEALSSLLVQLHQGRGRPLHIWCAGVATGEEAYTVSMLAAERDLPVHVLGTDVNTSFIEMALRAEYDDWSLRRLTDERRARFFEERDGRWAVRHEVAKAVEFRHHNLLDIPPPTSLGSWDVIMCRNVVIYLTDAARAGILARFSAAMSDDSYLLLGSGEPLTDESAPFRATRSGPSFVYRPNVTVPGKTLPFPTFIDDPSLDEETADFHDEDAIRRLLRDGVDHQDDDAAIACFEAAAGYDPFTPETHALLAERLDWVGARERARRAYGKVLFLDPDNWWAAARLARSHEASADRVEARRYWSMALSAIQGTEAEPFEPGLAIGALRAVNERRDRFRAEIVEAFDRLS